MKTLTTALLMSVFIAGPVLACPGMSAQVEQDRRLALATLVTPDKHEAMSTFDATKKPLFETDELEAVKDNTVDITDDVE